MAGYDSYIIAGEQGTDWDTPCLTASMKQIVYEFASLGLKNTGPNIRPTRFKRNASPMPGIEGFLNGEGDVEFNLHADDMVIWWKYLLGDDSVSSTDFTAQEVFGNGAGAGKAIPASPFSLDTQPTGTTPASDPGKLIFTLDTSDSGTVTITGTDQNDMAMSETITFTAEDTKTTTKYFKTVNASGIAYTGLTVASTLLITADKNTYTHVIEVKDALLNGLTIEAVKSGLPSTYIGCLLNSGAISVGDIVSLTTNLMCKRGWNEHKVPAAGSDPTPSTTPTDVSGYTAVSDKVFPAWGIEFYVDGAGSPTCIGSMSFEYNNNLVYPLRFCGVRTRPKPRRGDNREINLTVSIDYDTTNDDWDDWWEYMTDKQADVYCYCKPSEGPELSIQIALPRCQVGESPDPAVTDYSEVLQEVPLQAIRTIGATSPDEVEVTLVCTAAS